MVRVWQSHRLTGWFVTLLVVAGAIVPLTWSPSRDSFPVSSFPMFSDRRDDATVRLVVAGIETPDGFDVLPTEATGHRQLTQAVRALAATVEEGGDRPARMCAEVAAWVARTGNGQAGRVTVATVSYDGLAYLLDHARNPTIESVHASCEVPR